MNKQVLGLTVYPKGNSDNLYPSSFDLTKEYTKI